jgi:hypothetical protein
MSDVPQDDQNKDRRSNKNVDTDNNNQQQPGVRDGNKRRKPDGPGRSVFSRGLPPAPEDHFVLVGDLLSLSVYSFSDHFVCQDLAQFFLAPSSSASATLSSAASAHPPVWLDASHSYSDHVLDVLLRDANVVHYSPILQPIGLAATVLASCWLLSGWLNHAFAYRNTLDCSTPRTLLVTARSWVVSSLLVMAMVGLTSNTSPEHWWQAFTVGDIAYIWDSLTVLCVWRFMASSLLGSGGGGEDDTGGW